MRMLAALVAGRLELQRALRLADEQDRGRVHQVIADRGFRTVFQPIIDLRDGVIVGYEALTRFPLRHADRVVRDGGAHRWRRRPGDGDADRRRGDIANLPAGAYLAVNVSPAALCSAEFEASGRGAAAGSTGARAHRADHPSTGPS